MNFVIYEPASGAIAQCLQGSPVNAAATAAALGMALLPVPDDRPYETTHRVADGALVPLEPSGE